MKKIVSLLFAMLKVGFVGFGGGSALIPIIEQEVVNDKKIVSKKEYDQDVLVASITPGALPVEIAAGLGKRTFGIPGMLAAASCMAFPGVILTIVLISVFSKLGAELHSQIEFASIGITAFIICLLTEYIRTVIMESRQEFKARYYKTWGIIFSVFVLTAGKPVYDILGIQGTPIFSVSAIHVLSAAFFGILYTRCKFNLKNSLISVTIVVLYLLSVGKANIIHNEYLLFLIKILMVILSCYGLYQSINKSKNFKLKSMIPMIKEEAAWLIFLVILSIPAIFVSMDTITYLGKGLFSTVISFGGGDAYLTVADGMFVSDNLISSSEFYGRLVPVVNILPGSILCKTLAGIGYYIGYRATGSSIAGYWVAFAGFASSIAASSGVFSFVHYIYGCVKNLDVFQLIRRWIRPIVSGLLLNVIVAILYQGMQIGNTYEIRGFSIFAVVLGIYFLNLYLFYKVRIKSGIMIVISSAISLLVCNMI